MPKPFGWTDAAFILCVVAYVSGHGFGHSARQVEILRHLPAHIPLVVKTTAPEWFWRNELPRPFEFIAEAFDAGCIQSDSLTVDVPATLAAYQAVHERNRARWNREQAELRERDRLIVVTDVAAFPLVAAAGVGIPTVCVANFTWADIYADYVAEKSEFGPIVTKLEEYYRSTTLLLDADLSLPMPYFPDRERVGLVARKGDDRRDELLAALPPSAQNKRLALVYLGNWGFSLPYDRFAGFGGWHFVSLDDAPIPLSNWTKVSRELMAHPSLVASVDAVVSKAGYGLVGECLAHGTPLLYPPRTGFAEFAALHKALQAWPGGIVVTETDWANANFGPYLDAVPPRGETRSLPAPGGANAAARIARLWEENAISWKHSAPR